MRLRYKAVANDGKKVRGFIEAKEIKDAAYYLRQRNLIPIQINKEESFLFLKKLPLVGGGVKSKDVILFTRQLSSMLTSGLTLIKSLEILKEQTSNKFLQDTIGSVLLDIQEGKSFSDAIAKYPDVFSSVYVSLVRAGESSGLLDKIFLRLASNLEKQRKLRNTVKGALMYPMVVITLMFVVIFILMIFVIPQLSTLYESLNVTLPLVTRIVVGASSMVGKIWPFIFGVTGIFIYAFLRWKKTPRGKQIFDSFLLKVPLVGRIVKLKILTEFTITFGMLAGTGTLIVDALNQSAGVAGNQVYENAIKDISKKVEKGVPVGEAMSYFNYFPPILVQLIKVGEETGKMDENLLKASDYFEEEVNQAVKTLTTAMEPLIMIVLGIGVGFLVFSVITPIYSILNSVQ